MVAAEEALAAAIGGRVLFLVPLGGAQRHRLRGLAGGGALGRGGGTVNAVRVGAPAGDPEHTQALAKLTSRITAAAEDTFAAKRIANVSGLQKYYRDSGAYGDITPDDGATTTFTPASPQ